MHIYFQVIILITISVCQVEYTRLHEKIFQIIVKLNWTWIYMHIYGYLYIYIYKYT